MQASLKDLSNSPHDSPSFLVCQRVLLQCHEIIFGDVVRHAVPYSSLEIPNLPGTVQKKVKALTQPAIVGLGIMLAGAPGLPQLTQVVGEVAIEQGRADEEHEGVRSLEQGGDIVRLSTLSVTDSSARLDVDGEEAQDSVESEAPSVRPEVVIQPAPRSRLATRRQTIAAQTSPALPLHLQKAKPRLSEDPFGQNESHLPHTSAASPFVSTPSLPSSRHTARADSVQLRDLFKKYDFRTQTHFLRSHFCRSEVRKSGAGFVCGMSSEQILLGSIPLDLGKHL